MPLSTGAKVTLGATVGIAGGALLALALLRSRAPSPSPSPTPCTSNSECPSGYICVNGVCVPSTTSPPPCTSNSDCPTGYVCQNGQCVPGSSGPTPCTSNSDCPAGYVCVNGTCTVSSTPPPSITGPPVGCILDSQCPAGMTCVSTTSDTSGVPLSPTPNLYQGIVMGFCTAAPPSPLTVTTGPFAGSNQMCYPGVSPCPTGYDCAVAFTYPWPGFFIDPISNTSNAGEVGVLQAYVCYPSGTSTLSNPPAGAPGGTCTTHSDCGSFAPCFFGVCQNPPTWQWFLTPTYGSIWINGYGQLSSGVTPTSIPVSCTSDAGCPPGTTCGGGPAGAGWCGGPLGGYAPPVFATCPGGQCPSGYSCASFDYGQFCVASSAGTLTSQPYGGCLSASQCPSGYNCVLIGYSILPGDGGTWASQCVPNFQGATSHDFLYTPSSAIPALCSPSVACPSPYQCFEGLCYKSRATGTPAALHGGYIALGGWNDGGTGLSTNTIQCVSAADCPTGWNCMGTGLCSSVTGTSNYFFSRADLSHICPPGTACTTAWPQNEYIVSCANRTAYGLTMTNCPTGTICVGGSCLSVPQSSDCGTATGFQGGATGYCGPNGIEPAWLRPCSRGITPGPDPPCPPGTSCYGGIASYPGILSCNSQGLCTPLIGLCLAVASVNGQPAWSPELPSPQYFNPNAKTYCSTNADCIPGFICYSNGICMCNSAICATAITGATSDLSPAISSDLAGPTNPQKPVVLDSWWWSLPPGFHAISG